MLYTVHTSFSARDNESGYLRKWSSKDKVEAPDKDTAKYKAWKAISESGEYSFLTLESQNARESKRK